MRLLPENHDCQARALDLVAPLHDESESGRASRQLDSECTDMHTTDTARSGAASLLSDRQGGGNSAKVTRAIPTTPGTRTSTMAIRTTTTRTTPVAPVSSAHQDIDTHADFSFLELVEAYFDCRRHKRNTASALAFEADLERNLYTLHTELSARTYQPGRSICFIVTHPKVREVWAADFRDRIVHHLFYKRVAHRFELGFIADSSACLVGRGTLYAAQRLESKIRNITQSWAVPAFYLKLDLANFFVSIDKDILWHLLAAKIHEPFFRWLAHGILFHDPRPDAILRSAPALMAKVPDHKKLMNQPANIGLPIGNLSSQFFANVLLNPLDQFVKHVIRCRHYSRYVDDFILLHESTAWLNDAKAQIEQFLPTLGVTLNPRKTILQPVYRDVDFVGQVIKPGHRVTRRRTYRVALDRVATIDAADLHSTANSYFGLFRQATHGHQDRVALAKVLRMRGMAVDRNLTKGFRL